MSNLAQKSNSIFWLHQLKTFPGTVRLPWRMPENEAKQKQPFLYCQYLSQISEPGDILQNVLCHFNDEIIEIYRSEAQRCCLTDKIPKNSWRVPFSSLFYYSIVLRWKRFELDNVDGKVTCILGLLTITCCLTRKIQVESVSTVWQQKSYYPKRAKSGLKKVVKKKITGSNTLPFFPFSRPANFSLAFHHRLRAWNRLMKMIRTAEKQIFK